MGVRPPNRVAAQAETTGQGVTTECHILLRMGVEADYIIIMSNIII